MRLQQIKHWFNKIGVVQTKCELREISDGHSGLFATSDIEPDEVILKIPKSVLVSAAELQQSPQFKKFARYYPQIFNEILNDDADFNLLVLFLLLEKQKADSFYKPYLDYVEKPKNCLALSYEEVEGLGDRNLQLAIIRMKQGFEKNFSYFKTFYQEQFNSDLKYSEFLWAYQFVMTRCFGGDDHIQSSTLVPFGDMLNHHDKSQLLHEIAVSENDQEFLIFYAIEKVASGEEVFNYFGKLGNGYLYCWYGFAYRENLFDKLYISVDEQGEVVEASCFELEEREGRILFALRKGKQCKSKGFLKKGAELVGSTLDYQGVLRRVEVQVSVPEIRASQGEILEYHRKAQ